MIKQLLLVSALMSGTATVAIAQSYYRPGYILPLAGDTIKGQVDQRSEARNSRLCSFRPATGSETEYSPEQLRGFGFSKGPHFEALALPIAVDKMNVAFVERLVKGPASLYTLQDAGSLEHFYLRTATEPLQELTQSTATINRDNSRYLSTDKAYQRTLAQAFQSCPAMQSSLSSVILSAGSLTKAVAKYNACTGATQETVVTEGRTNKLRIKALGGVESATLDFDGEVTVLDQESFKSALSPSVGLSLAFSPRAFHRSLSLSLDVLYSSFKESRTFYDNNKYTYNPEREARFAFSHIRIPVMLRYTYAKGAVQPFIAGGVEFGYATKMEADYRYVGTDRWSAVQDDFPTRKAEQGPVAAIGLTTARLAGRNASLEARFSRSNGFSQASGIGTHFVRVAALLAIDLTK